MNFTSYRNLFFAILIPLLFSCRKENFNFHHLQNVEASGEWGIPVANARYSVEDLLDQFDNQGYIIQEANGNLLFNYEIEKEEIIRASDFMFFENISKSKQYRFENQYSTGTTVELPFEHAISIDSEQFIFSRADIKTGMVILEVSHNIDQPYSVEVVSPDIITAAGLPFRMRYDQNNGNHFNRSIDISNFTITPSDTNKIRLEGKIIFTTSTGPSGSPFIIDSRISIQNLRLRSVSGKMAPYMSRIDEKLALDLLSRHYSGSITLHNPRVTLYTKNSFPMPARHQIDTAQFGGPHGAVSLLDRTPVTVDIPVSPNNYYEQTINELSSLTLSSDYTSLQFTGKMTVNPDGFDAGEMYITEESSISVKLRVTIPFRLNIRNVSYQDTVHFNLDTVESMDILDNVSFRMVFTNGLPVNVNAQLYFYDSGQQTILDSLFSSALHLRNHNSTSGTTNDQTHFVEVSRDKLNRLASADRIIFRFHLDTPNGEVIFNSSDFLKVILGMKMKYNSSGHDFSNNSK